MSDTTSSTPLLPPTDLPVDPRAFWRVGPGVSALIPEAQAEPPVSALDRLGSSPLPKAGFPFIGFLASVYEHVSAHARGEPPREG